MYVSALARTCTITHRTLCTNFEAASAVYIDSASVRNIHLRHAGRHRLLDSECNTSQIHASIMFRFTQVPCMLRLTRDGAADAEGMVLPGEAVSVVYS